MIDSIIPEGLVYYALKLEAIMTNNEDEKNPIGFKRDDIELTEILAKLSQSSIIDFTKRFDSIVDDFNVKLINIIDDLASDSEHNSKRILSFKILDRIFNGCHEGKCHDIKEENLKDIHNLLIDISADGYINERAYFYSKDEIGQDDFGRHCMAANRLNVIFSCKKIPNLNDSVFDYDTKDLNVCHLENSKRRKAYWAFLKNSNCSSSVSNYESACYFVEKLRDLQNKIIDTSDSDDKEEVLNELKELLSKNLHIANTIDIFRYCHLRGKFESANKLI